MNKSIQLESYKFDGVLYTLEFIPGQEPGRGDLWRIMAQWIDKPDQPARQLKMFTDGTIAERDFWERISTACRWGRFASAKALFIHRKDVGLTTTSAASRESIDLPNTLIVPILLHDLEEVNRRIQNGYDVNTELIFDPGRRHISFTHLHFAARGDFFSSSELIQPSLDLMNYLIDTGADPHARNTLGNTPLHVVKSAKAAELLLDHGADLHARNNNGLTAEDLFKKRATETSEEDMRANYLEIHQFLKSRRERQELLDIAKQTRQKTHMPGSADKRRAL